jgi:hypothetical protein
MNCDECQFAKDVKETRADVKEIKDALLGNEFNPGGGLIKKQQMLKTRMDKFDKKLIYVSGIGSGLGLALGYVISLFIKHTHG